MIPGRGKRFLSSPKCSHQDWGPPSLPFKENQVFLPHRQNGQEMKLTIQHLQPRNVKV